MPLLRAKPTFFGQAALRLPATAALCLAAVAPVAAQHHLFTFNGDKARDYFGYSVRAAGDINRDGHADIIVGARGNDTRGIDAGAAYVFSGKDGRRFFTFYGAGSGDSFGVSVSSAGDMNGDGFPDVLVGAWQNDWRAVDAGAAQVFSGNDGRALFSFVGDSAGDGFGHSVASAGDVNRDGFDDIVVGAHLDDNKGVSSGMARVLSGRTGGVLWSFNGDSARDELGHAVSGAGDVNKDGYADILVGAPLDDNKGTDSGMARVYSGKNGATLFSFNGDSAGDRFGRAVASAGDVDKDGWPDLIVGAYLDDNKGTDSGMARVFSGRSGAALWTFNGDSAGDWFGYTVAGAGDIDGDGHADLVVGAYRDVKNGKGGSAFVYAGKSGKLIQSFVGDGAFDGFGFAVSGTGDVNGDGRDDLVSGAIADDNSGTDAGSARVISGAALTLATANATQHEISMTGGGTQALEIYAPATHAHKVYLLMGTFSGTKPGVQLQAFHLPLNPDAYTMYTMLSPNQVILGSLGILDASGRATSFIRIPPNSRTDIAGLFLHHAYAVFDPATNQFLATSNATPLKLLR